MLGVHTVIGLLEGLITIAIFAYLQQVCPEIFDQLNLQPSPAKRKKLYTAIAIATIIVAAGLSITASSLPDGLEWSYAHRPDQPDFTPMTDNTSPAIEQADQMHNKISLMPDYNSALPPGWKSFAGVTGSLITMSIIWIAAYIIRRKETPANASHTH
jgi:cobalt/nickel transport system permease protein